MDQTVAPFSGPESGPNSGPALTNPVRRTQNGCQNLAPRTVPPWVSVLHSGGVLRSGLGLRVTAASATKLHVPGSTGQSKRKTTKQLLKVRRLRTVSVHLLRARSTPFCGLKVRTVKLTNFVSSWAAESLPQERHTRFKLHRRVERDGNKPAAGQPQMSCYLQFVGEHREPT